MFCVTALFNIVLDVLIRSIRQAKKLKIVMIEEEEMKLSFSNDLNVYTENLKESTGKLFQLEFRSVKIKLIYENQLFLFTKNMKNLKNAIYKSIQVSNAYELI